MMGIARHKLIKQPLSRFIPPEYQNTYYLRRKQLRETGKPQKCELRIIKNDATSFWAHLTATVIEDIDTALINIIVLSDITERKQAEEALHESEKHYRTLVEGTPGIVYAFSSKRGGVYYSSRTTEILGYSPEQLYAQPMLWHNSIHPDDLPIVEQSIRNTTTFKPFCIEYRILDSLGNWRWFEDRSTGYHVDGTDVIMEGLALDITERKLVEMELRESEERYRLLFESASDALFLIASDTGMVVKANSIASELYGYDPDELLTKKSMDLSAEPEETRRLTHAAQTAPDNVLSIPMRLHRKKDGNVFPVEITARSFPLKARQVLLVAVRDITNRKRAEAEKAELEALNRQLQKAESLGHMAGGIAHHFNNQLYAVMGNLEMAMDDLPLGVNSNENLVSAMQAARKAADVSRLMLTYLGQTPGKHEPIDLSETCRQNLPLLQAATPKGIILSAEFPPSGPIIRADTNQIHQIFTNLITNAWESTSDNRGTIALTVKTVPHVDIPASNRFPMDWQPKESNYACLEVSDTGCGISNKDIEKIFDPFFTTKFTGRGLGLPVVMGIVKAHAGGITVESEPGHGSTFRIFLPVSTDELPLQHDLSAMPEALPTSKAEKLSKIEGGGMVLLIEDEEPVRNMARMMLTRLGYKVIEAIDGVEALEIFHKHQDEIFFVLSDLTMPRMDGWETLAALRKLSPDIPVVLSSGYDKAQVMAGDHTEQPDAFLGKPYQLKGLRETINRVLAAPVHL
jgi:PAS domain S-box-containing protein